MPTYIRYLLFITLLWQATAFAQTADLPEDFEQIIPRGRIAAINEPQYVKAAEADIADNEWVLGVLINGQARVYSLTLLNSHEIVNDTIDSTAFAAVW